MKLLFQKLHPPLAALLLAALAGQGHAQNNLTNGLVAYYPFNGNANDESGGARHGVVNGATLGTNRFGLANSAYVFNGASFVDFPNAPQLGLPNTAFTVSLWVQAAGVGPIFGDYEGTATIGDEIFALHISLDNNPAHSALPNYLSITSRNFPTLGRDDTFYLGDSPLIGSGWHFVAYVMDGVGTCRVTVDGVLKATLPYNPALNYNQAPRLQAGRVLFAGQQQFFTGSMDDIRIYNRALATTEVAQLYAQDSDPLKVGLVAHYPFNGNVTDASGSGIIAAVRNGENYVPSPIGIADRALRFSGSLNSVSLPDDTRLRNVRTVSAWFNCPAFPNLNGPIAFRGDARGGNDPFQFGIKPSGVIDFTINAGFAGITQGVLVSDNPVTLNAWHHVVATYTDAGGIMALYLDGVLLKTTAGVTAPVAELNAGSDPGWGIGNHPGLTQTIHNQQFTGLIDEVRFYNRPLRAAEVTALYASEAPITAPQRVAPSTVVAWGANNYGQATVPAGLTNAVAITSGTEHSLALRSDGTVVAWGRNSWGQLNVPAGLTNIVSIAAGTAHSFALRSNGTVVHWGANYYGSANIPAGLTNVIAITSGTHCGVALKSDGTVVAWGLDLYGQATVPTGLSNVVAIAAGGGHVLALKSDGTVVAWGSNVDGESTVPAGLNNVVAIAASEAGSHNLALKRDGTVVQWGANHYGQGNTPAGLSNVVAIAAGAVHSLVLKDDGTVVAWGDNSNGQSTVPVGLGSVAAIAASYQNLVILVPPIAPTITSQPQAQTLNAGTSVTFSVTATGTGPFSYQWQFNGTTLAGATNSTLTRTNLTFGHAGSYRIVVTSPYGTATSTAARLHYVGLNLYPVLTIADAVGSAYRIEVTSDLVNTNVWTTLTNLTLPSSPYDFMDKSTPQPLRRFYRAVPLP